MPSLEDNMKYMKSEGFEVSVWLWALACHNPGDFTRLTGFNLKQSQNQCCPLDENFLDFAASCIREIAQLNPTMILFRRRPKIRSPRHRARLLLRPICATLKAGLGGEEQPKDKLTEFSSAASRINTAVLILTSMGDSIRNFARRMPRGCRLGHTLKYGSRLYAPASPWDIDGVDLS